ncbi:MAG: PilZ domain-containing protein, partial [Candidatus Omnitrophota bacterium]|nr:PilZ domain-containing protein [Candidatus Omnitrophota bacterium]
EKLKAKDFLELELELHDSSKPIKLVGQVMWLKELSRSDEKERRLFYVGIKFAKINPDSEAILLTHLNTLKHPEI